jgi:hypothetical protein
MSGNATPVLVRYNRAEGYFEAQCADCAREDRQSYWELSTDFWVPSQGLQHCKAHLNTRRRLARRAAMDSKAKQRQYYREHRAHRLEWVKEWRNRDREGYNAKRRAAYARRVAARREAQDAGAQAVPAEAALAGAAEAAGL